MIIAVVCVGVQGILDKKIEDHTVFVIKGRKITYDVVGLKCR